jgi:beta-phosphoglucomutase family hydrolase
MTVLITRDRYDGAAFDLDGVLTKTALVHEAAWKQIFDEFLARRASATGEPFAPFTGEDYRLYVDGRPRNEGISAFLASRGVSLPEGQTGESADLDTVQELGRRKNEAFAASLDREGVEVYPEAVDLVGRLRRGGVRTAVVSASKNCRAVLQAAGIHQLFDTVIDGLDQVELALKGKPAPDTFLQAARRLGIEPARTAVIEDAVAGVAAGHAGGFGLVIGVDRTGAAATLLENGADVVVSDLGSIEVDELRAADQRAPSFTQPVGRKSTELRPPTDAADKAQVLDTEIETDPWTLSYAAFDPALEGRREALFTVGNGYFATRGSAAEAIADGVHYPGTYLAGGYNRLVSQIDGRPVEHEDLVNLPNWLPLLGGVRQDGGPSWFSPHAIAKLLHHKQELDLRRGLYRRSVRYQDADGRITRIDETRLVHMREPHLAAQQVTATAENWSGSLAIRAALDGRVTNAGVPRYRPYDGRHFRTPDAAAIDAETILLEAETTQSRLLVAQAARTRFFRGDRPFDPERLTVGKPGYIGQQAEVELAEGESVTVEKIVALYTSRDRAIADPRTEALTAISRAGGFEELVGSHELAWTHLWRQCDLEFVRVRGEPNHDTHRILRLHIFHLLQTISPHTIDIDAGVPARGWHGEAYRGHIFWDELFIFPFLNMRLPDLTRALLLYRYRRLPEARAAAREAGYRGAMFPWQSGSNGREETDTEYFNPRSERFIWDNTHLQRHVGAAIGFNVWQYYEATGDAEFLHDYGAELLLEIARFWASIAEWNGERQRYEIRGVMGPDEFHDAYPGAAAPGLDNNAYTNVMASWCVERALRLADVLAGERWEQLCETLQLGPAELALWEEVSHKMFVPFQDEGIISQFEGYEELEEFDWESYRERYGNIMRLDLILEAEGDTPNRYKLSKQPDVLMLFYLFSTEALTEIFGRLGYEFNGAMIPKNIDYYLKRSSLGSTLSGVVHAWVLARSLRPLSWNQFKTALRSDIDDIQGGTTAEGIHLGAMAGTVDLLQRCYTGIELRDGELWFNPSLPDEILRLNFQLRYRQHSLQIDIAEGKLSIVSDPAAAEPITIRLKTQVCILQPGKRAQFTLQPGHRTKLLV